MKKIYILLLLIILAGCTIEDSDPDKTDSFKLPLDNPTNDYFIFVDVNNGTNGASGTMTDPVDDINEGIGIADSQGKDVCVAQGSYIIDSSSAVNGEIIVKEGVSLYGGYYNAGGVWTRDTALYMTYIFDTASGVTSVRTVYIDTTVTRSTKIDGFQIRTGEGNTAGYAVFCQGSPVITNNKIYGYASINTPTSSIALYCSDGSPLIRNNYINGCNGSASSRGINLYNSNAEIIKNEIIGGTGNTSSCGILILDSSPVIYKNEINAGSASNSVYGISISTSMASSCPIIEGNTITFISASNSTGIIETTDESEPEYVFDNSFNASFDCYYFDASGGNIHICSTINDVNSLDENGYNDADSVYDNELF